MKLHPIAQACLALVLAPVAAFGQDQPPIGDAPARSPAKLERVEINARPDTDTDLRRKSSVAKQVYGREELDRYGDTNVSDVMKRLPGVNIVNGAPQMRGLGGGYTLILINGDPAPPGFAFDQLDPAQVERIEVSKAPTADQSAQAVAGTINIILKVPPRSSTRNLRMNVGYNATRPVVAGTFTYGEKVGGLSYSAPVSVFQWRGLNEFSVYRDMPGYDFLPSQSTQYATQPYWGHGFNATPSINWKLGDEQTLSLLTFLQKGNWNTLTDYVNEVVPGQNPSLDQNNLGKGGWQLARGNLQWVDRFSDSQRVELKLGAQDASGTFDNLTYPTDATLTPQRHSVGDNRDKNLTQSGKYAQLLGDEHSMTVGWDLEWRQHDETRSVTLNGVSQLPTVDGVPFSARIERQALFVQDEWEISPRWSTYIGLRGERIVTKSGDDSAGSVENVSRVVSPLWHLNYKIDPKGKELIRASLTRTYKAPGLNQMLAREQISGLFPLLDANGNPQTNTALAPDSIGNPNLKPELATGLDIAYEKYLAGGGMFSIGAFHRSVTNLIRTVTDLNPETVPWSTVPRYVARTVNFSKAQTTGLELEVKGRAGELMPGLVDARLPLNLRAAFNLYHSEVEALPGPNNRLVGQQPWSANLGMDYRLKSLPVNTGFSLTYMPGYTTTQTTEQATEQSRTRGLDMFAQWIVNKTTSMRLSMNNAVPVDTQSATILSNGNFTQTDRTGRTQYGLSMEMKL